MKNCTLCILLLCAPALAAISQKQAPVSQFNSGASSTCSKAFGSTPTAGDLFVVWTYWSTGPSTPNQLTASVKDSFLPPNNNTFVSAVGPTLQVGSNTAAQIFYVANLKSPGSGSDTLTVTYSGSAATSGCVFVEYQGADPHYPLDSVSAGYGYNSGTLLDSGTAAPANANLLVFGGGTTDAANLVNLSVVSPFTAITANLTSITEQFINSSPNNTLQRAQANSTAAGNWLMQMAIFRDASWTVTGGWNPARPAQVQFADQFPGSDPCAQTKAAIETNIGGNNSPVVDSRGFIATAIPCAAAPFATSDSFTWYPASGSWNTNVPWILGTQMELIGTGIGPAAGAGGTVVQAQNSAWKGGLGALAQGAYVGGGTCPGGPHCYTRGQSVTDNGTFYALQNNFANIEPGVTANWQAYWSVAANVPSPVFQTQVTTIGTYRAALHNLGIDCQYTAGGGSPNTPTDGCIGYASENFNITCDRGVQDFE